MDAVYCGIDPGLRVTGYAAIQHDAGACRLLDAGTFRVPVDVPLAERLHRLQLDAEELFREHQPVLIGVEQLYSHYQHPRTAILMGHARGVILAAAARLGIPVRGFAATRIKRFLTGNGRAPKSQVQRAIQRELGLAELPSPPDVADAAAIAMFAAVSASNSNSMARVR